MNETPDLFAALAAPIDPSLILKREGGFGRMLDYVTARTVMDRLDSVLGPANWWDHYQIIPGGILCAITIKLPNGELVTKEDAGGPQGMKDPGDDLKSAFSDAFKRAAVKFGVARYLETAEPITAQRTTQTPAKTGEPDWGARRAPANTPARDHSNHFPPPPDKPRTGRELFGWIKNQEKETGREILKPLNLEAKKLGISGRTIDWSPEQVERLLPFAHQLAFAQELPLA